MNFFIKIIILAITFLMLVSSVSYNDLLAQIYSMQVAFYRLRGSIVEYRIIYLAIITISLLGSIATGLFERKIGFRNTKFSILVALTLIAAITAHLEYLNSTPVSIQLFTWIDTESLRLGISSAEIPIFALLAAPTLKAHDSWGQP
jgi:hypothetical protein